MIRYNKLADELNYKIVKKNLCNIRGTVIDLGCGTKPYEKLLLSAANKYIGVDWENTQHGLHADVVADLNGTLPIQSEMADSVVSFQVMEHLCEPQIMLDEAYRILKQSGVFVLTVPFQWRVHEEPHDYFRFTRYGLEYMLKKSGFIDVIIEESTGFWIMWSLKLNYQLNRINSPKVPKLVRWILLPFVMPIWILNQSIAPFLDKYWPETRETAGYSATAHKP